MQTKDYKDSRYQRRKQQINFRFSRPEMSTEMVLQKKRQRTALSRLRSKSNPFNDLHDDLVLSILSKLASSASSPSQLCNLLLTCRRMHRLGLHPVVLVQLRAVALSVGARNWSDYAHRFLNRCVLSGNIEAHYILGMIRFYCLENRASGLSLLSKAATRSHAPSLYSLAVIHFNGSGKSREEKDLRAGVSLCVRAAITGHVDALREVGHCLQDGYGVRRDVVLGRRLLIQANHREFLSVLSNKIKGAMSQVTVLPHCLMTCPGSRDFVVSPEAHPVHKVLVEWFELHGPGHGLKTCSNRWCGRAETRAREFRRCSVCSSVHYCSRGCQALHWRSNHKDECVPVVMFPGHEDNGDDGDGEVVLQIQ